jgi:ribokinase
MTSFAVVGHVEWIEFARDPRLPQAGEVVHASETWQEAGGGGGMAAVQLAKLAGGADFFTALADDASGERTRASLEAHGVRVHAAPRAALDPPSDLVVTTERERGGRWETAAGASGCYAPAPLPGPVCDAYGPGDCFAAALTLGLGDGRGLEAALELAARAGAHKLAGRAPFEGMLSGA